MYILWCWWVLINLNNFSMDCLNFMYICSSLLKVEQKNLLHFIIENVKVFFVSKFYLLI